MWLMNNDSFSGFKVSIIKPVSVFILYFKSALISKDSGFCFQHFETVFILHYSFLKNDLYLNNVCNVAMLYIMESKNLYINFLIYKFRTPWLFFFQIKLLVLLALVGMVCGQCNDFNIQYQCLMNANQRLDTCEKACPPSQYGCSRTRCQLECQKQAYQRLTFCIIHE